MTYVLFFFWTYHDSRSRVHHDNQDRRCQWVCIHWGGQCGRRKFLHRLPAGEPTEKIWRSYNKSGCVCMHLPIPTNLQLFPAATPLDAQNKLTAQNPHLICIWFGFRFFEVQYNFAVMMFTHPAKIPLAFVFSDSKMSLSSHVEPLCL